MGVWRCPCLRFNGAGFDYCQASPRPDNDEDRNHPGLKIVVNESFKEIVLDEFKHVFLDVSADWCGPSVQMKPEWHALASLLKDEKDLVIGYMGADRNEKDRFFLAENHVPNLKLFPKGDKRNFVSFPSNLQRTVSGFLQFLSKHTKLDIALSIKTRLPEYLEKYNIASVIAKAEAAVVRELVDIKSIRTVCPEIISVEKFDVQRFLAMFWQHQSVFESVCLNEVSKMKDSEDVIRFIVECVSTTVLDLLGAALPDKPEEYLAQAMPKMSVTSKSTESPRNIQSCARHSEISLWIEACNAVKKNDLKSLEIILVQKKLLPAALEDPKSIDSSLMCLAAAQGDTKLLELLFLHGGDLNETVFINCNVVTPIDVAAMIGHAGVTSWLLDHGSFFGRSLQHAARVGDVTIVKILLKYRAHPDVCMDGKSPMTLAVCGQHGSVLEALVDARAQVDIKLGADMCKALDLDPDSTILHFAAKNNLISCVKAILHAWPTGAGAKNKAGLTAMDLAPVHVKCYISENFLSTLFAIRKCTIGGASSAESLNEITELFAKKQADPDAQDVRGWTALMASAISGDEALCTCLLDHNANWSLCGRCGFTALFWAEVSIFWSEEASKMNDTGSVLNHTLRSFKVAELLRGKGAVLSSKEQTGLELLKSAFKNGSNEVKSLLLLSCDAPLIVCTSSSAEDKENMQTYGLVKEEYRNIIQRISENAASIQESARLILPEGYKPEVTLEQSILLLHRENIKVVEKWHQERPDEGDFPSWKSLIDHAKLFVQERLAAGDSLPPQYIFALHLYTIPCNLFQQCCKYMREGNSTAIKPFQVFVWYLWNAINCLSASPRTVFRGLFNVNPWEILRNSKGQIVWPAFSSTTFARAVALSFMAESKTGAVMFKIKAKSCREIFQYSYRPHEKELLLPPMTRFVVRGIYNADNYNISFGEKGMDGLLDLGLNSIVPMHEISMEMLLEKKPSSVLVLMEEMDLEESGF